MTTNPLDEIQARTDAATEGPWFQRGCTPCEERGRLEVNIWDHTGNFLITSWCDDDDEPGPDAEFIAHAREDVPKLVAALRAVEAACAASEDVSNKSLFKDFGGNPPIPTLDVDDIRDIIREPLT